MHLEKREHRWIVSIVDLDPSFEKTRELDNFGRISIDRRVRVQLVSIDNLQIAAD